MYRIRGLRQPAKHSTSFGKYGHSHEPQLYPLWGMAWGYPAERKRHSSPTQGRNLCSRFRFYFPTVQGSWFESRTLQKMGSSQIKKAPPFRRLCGSVAHAPHGNVGFSQEIPGFFKGNG